MNADKRYCMSSFLMFRTIADETKCFKEGMISRILCEKGMTDRKAIHDSRQLEDYLKTRVKQAAADKRIALALSGGIDSAILAKFMPKGSVAYTFKCIVPGIDVVDETSMAAKYARECGLEHRVVEVYWEDFEKYAPLLMAHKGMPIHSIEVQIYKAALQAKADGMDGLILGENADIIYGGMDGLLAEDWRYGEFIERYTYVMPYKVLRDSQMILEPYQEFEQNGHIDGYEFTNKYFRREALGTYTNACETADITVMLPYAETYLAEQLDYGRIRGGESKYLIREVFRRLYSDFAIPRKIPMPRPMNEWLQDWEGPVRPEFWPHCTDHMTGDQKWLVWCLEKFLNMLDGM